MHSDEFRHGDGTAVSPQSKIAAFLKALARLGMEAMIEAASKGIRVVHFGDWNTSHYRECSAAFLTWVRKHSVLASAPLREDRKEILTNHGAWPLMANLERPV